SWRWRYRFGDELYRRFWGQVVRWAVSSRLGAEDDHVRLGTDKLIYPARAQVTVEALIQESPGKAFEGQLVDAVLTRSGDGAQKRVRLELIPKSGGRYKARTSLESMGPPAQGPSATECQVRLDLPDIPGYSQKEKQATATFVIEPEPDPESLDLTCN